MAIYNHTADGRPDGGFYNYYNHLSRDRLSESMNKLLSDFIVDGEFDLTKYIETIKEFTTKAEGCKSIKDREFYENKVIILQEAFMKYKKERESKC